MKAKQIAKIRNTCRYYSVQVTDGLFGSFYGILSYTPQIIFAKNHRNACIRAKRRGIGLTHSVDDYGFDSEKWASWKVRELTAPDNFKHIKYY